MQISPKKLFVRSLDKKKLQPLLVALIASCCLNSGAFAAETAAEKTYSGDFLTRSTLTGDWGGARNNLANKGITFDANLVMTEQGVTDGGTNSHWENGGRGNLLFKADTGKLGLWPGGFLTVEVEGLFGKSVNARNNGLVPVDTNSLFPIPATEEVAIPALNYTQFLSHNLGVVVGKLDTTSGDSNEFADGKGDSQFMNTAFNLNPALMMTTPYSTLGVAAIIVPTKDPHAALVTVSAVSATGDASKSGFDELSSGSVSYNVEARVRTDFFGKTGHQLVGGIYSNKDYSSIDQRLTFDHDLDTALLAIEKKTDSWAAYYNFDQYLLEPVKGSGKGVGIFGRFSATDGDPNLIHYFYSLGIGGKGMSASRPNDRFGIGWYYLDINNPTITIKRPNQPDVTRKFLRDEQGIEAYYSIALTPWAHVTPNIQYTKGAQKQRIAPPNEDIDNATILGLRMQLIF